ncbi:MAG: asparaginase domain-containing protein [Hydrogenovibrio sp.]|nr:asparaginase domain-containing protein [Hydrogenovibrio sp.]
MSPDASPIHLLITGGTLDKDYEATTGELVFNSSHLPEILQQANVTLAIESDTLMLKDSLEMTDKDRESILNACLRSSQRRLVITHGTDTMTQTADLLKNHPDLSEKTIILTGAMRPFKLGMTDASFNLGSALMAVQLAPPGVYLTMNGQLFKSGRVVKNRDLGIFQTDH